jgi:hypothetical protein
MNELDQKQWAVKSERGRETSGVTYKEAAQLVQNLSEQKYTASASLQTRPRSSHLRRTLKLPV